MKTCYLSLVAAVVCGCSYIFAKPPACVLTAEAVAMRQRAKMLPIDDTLFCYRSYEYEGRQFVTFKRRDDDSVMKEIVCCNGVIEYEKDLFYSGKVKKLPPEFAPPPEIQRGMRPESDEWSEHVRHLLVQKDGMWDDCPKGNHWFYGRKKITATEAETLLKNWKINK